MRRDCRRGSRAQLARIGETRSNACRNRASPTPSPEIAEMRIVQRGEKSRRGRNTVLCCKNKWPRRRILLELISKKRCCSSSSSQINQLNQLHQLHQLIHPNININHMTSVLRTKWPRNFIRVSVALNSCLHHQLNISNQQPQLLEPGNLKTRNCIRILPISFTHHRCSNLLVWHKGCHRPVCSRLYRNLNHSSWLLPSNSPVNRHQEPTSKPR